MFKFYYKMRDIIVPGLRNSQYAYKDYLKRYINQGSKWLDLGCGHQILPEWMPRAQEEETALVQRSMIFVGIDCDYPSLQKHKTLKYKVIGDIQRLPFKDNSFNLVTANMVVEHLKDPAELLLEVQRVLQPNGFFIFHTPNLLHPLTMIGFLLPKPIKNKLIELLEGRKEEDIFPTHYRLNTPKKIKRLAQLASFKLIDLKLLSSSAETVMLGPLVIIELLLIRAFASPALRNLRSNIIAVFQRKQ